MKTKETKNKVNETKETKKVSSIEKLQNIAKFASLKSSLGVKKSSIYKEDIFEDLDEKQKKSLRKKIRNLLLSFVKSEINENNIKAFNSFYCEFYKVQDYTLQSVCSENLDENKKKQISEFLDKVKKAKNKF